MPYRRLPNTDNARIRALRTAIEKSRQTNQNVISLDLLGLELTLRNFENLQIHYRECLKIQANENAKFQKYIKNARLYLSHFIQVFNFCIIRGEIKKEVKELYKMGVDSFTVPDLSTNDLLEYWGDNVIKGEQERLARGGAPIYNPTIARVNVAFSQFKDAYYSQKRFQANTARQLEALAEQRTDIDKMLTTIWNQIEDYFSGYSNGERLQKCKEYGVIYYLRKGEKEKAARENH